MKKILASVLLLLVFASPAAFAANHPKPHHPQPHHPQPHHEQHHPQHHHGRA
jgi:Spy/CpxP family protein refolding chaperone